MKYCSVLIFLWVLNPAAVFADMASPKDSFERINQCVQKENPQNASYISQQNIGKNIVIHANSAQGNTRNSMRLIFTQEEGQWKLNVPESLHLGLGDNWEQQLNLTEQAYLIMKQQMGMQLSCDAINNLANASHL